MSIRAVVAFLDMIVLVTLIVCNAPEVSWVPDAVYEAQAFHPGPDLGADGRDLYAQCAATDGAVFTSASFLQLPSGIYRCRLVFQMPVSIYGAGKNNREYATGLKCGRDCYTMIFGPNGDGK